MRVPEQEDVLHSVANPRSFFSDSSALSARMHHSLSSGLHQAAMRQSFSRGLHGDRRFPDADHV